MKFSIHHLALFAAFSAVLPSCNKDTESEAAPAPEEATEEAVSIIDLDAAGAAPLVASGEIAVLDVRTPEGHAAAHIESATLIDIHGEGFQEGVAKLDQSKPYLVHCASGVDGGRSRKAIEALQAAGATKVYHLDGGLNAWMEGDHPVTKE